MNFIWHKTIAMSSKLLKSMENEFQKWNKEDNRASEYRRNKCIFLKPSGLALRINLSEAVVTIKMELPQLPK